MRIRSNRLYPYPILCTNSLDYSDNSFNANIDIEYDSEIATILIEIELGDAEIGKLIREREVWIYCHLDSPTTKYREIFEVELDKNNHAEKAIRIESINGNIELTCLMIAQKDIYSFTDANFSGLYLDHSVNFPKYATIGYTDTVDIEIQKKIDVNGEVPSIFKITPNDDEGAQLTFDATNEYIYIYLPREQYNIYMDYKGQNKRLKTMMINLPVLTEIIASINSGIADYSEQPWYEVIEQSIKKKGLGELGKDFTTRQAIEIAQSLLGDITKDAFDEFDKSLSKGV